MKKVILFLLLFLFLIANTALSYSVETHKIISGKATENSKLALDKGDYLKDLGFQNNIGEEFSGKTVIDLIKVGKLGTATVLNRHKEENCGSGFSLLS